MPILPVGMSSLGDFSSVLLIYSRFYIEPVKKTTLW